jgi:mannose-6-phosphate isomerase
MTSPDLTHPYPFVTEPLLYPKVWGGRRLAKLGKHLPPESAPNALIGESWEVADLDATSASGAGGGAACSRVASGAARGGTLRECTRAWGTDLLGPVPPGPHGAFPLLVKYLDAREHLSVQVHPSPAYAKAHPGAHLKTESWLVVAAEPGSLIYKGLADGVGPAEFREHIARGTVAQALHAVPAVVGECHTLPSGTIHALGAGVLVAEVQTPSDTTFRVDDWRTLSNRPQRELHVEQALACIDFDPATGRGPAAGRAAPGAPVVARTEFYRIAELSGHCAEVPLETPGTGLELAATGGRAAPHAAIVMILGGMGAGIAGPKIDAKVMGELMLRPGDTLVVPACCTEGAVLRCGPMTRALVARVG